MVTVIIVTHNSQAVLARCLAAIEEQSRVPDQVVICDSGSDDCAYLDEFRGRSGYQIEYSENIGFAAANNRALARAGKRHEYILFLNPDAFLNHDAIEKSLQKLAARDDVAVLAARLTGYDLDKHEPTGVLDSTGIFRAWYGRWFDRGQGEQDLDNYQTEQSVPAVCGAFMFCRSAALKPLLPEVFDETFFMYKEDIDLSLRLRRMGWNMLYTPEIRAYHCRGWRKKRGKVDRRTRLLAAKNEIKLTCKHRSPYLGWALAKYVLVFTLNV